MTRSRSLLAIAVAIAIAPAASAAGQSLEAAAAPTAPAPTASSADAAVRQLDTVVVTGTRATGRSAKESASPIEIISTERLQATGFTDLARALQFSEPSLNFPRAATTPSSANTRPITLRGLSPDEVLVLVNGKRTHASSVINVNFAVGRGSAPFDLSTIPLAAIDHVEVLRSGAAAQYGSDAIAGVVNILLRSNDSGGSAQLQAGITEAGDGQNATVAFNRGATFGGGGRITVSGEIGHAQPTNRAAVDQRFGRKTYRIGNPDADTANLVASVAYPLAALGGELYDDLLLSRKDSTSAVAFRPPSASLPMYPRGTLPLVNPVLEDVGNTLGLRGTFGDGIDYDLGSTFGYSDAEFRVRDSGNATLGAASPTRFDAGGATYRSSTTTATLSRALPGVLAGGNVAAGVEYRHEAYELGNGEQASIVGAGSVGFPGFNPRIPVDNARNARAAFVDVELKPLRWLSLGVAGRYDDYSDFGGASTWKATFRVEASATLALRGSLGTGFRAPSLQQQYFSSISTVANGPNRSLVNVGTFQVGDPVARALGASPLKAETSRDAGLGAVWTPLPGLSVSADVFRTAIDDRIALSDALQGAQVQAVLSAAGITNVQQAAFFTNAVDTVTKGVDVSARYAGAIDASTDYSVSLGYEHARTTIERLQPNPALPSLPLIALRSRVLLTQAQPVDKLTSLLTLYRGAYVATLGATWFGEYSDAAVSTEQRFGDRTIVDLSLSRRLNDRVSLAAGVLNAGDVYPHRLEPYDLVLSSTGGSFLYGETTPWGVDGRAYFVRLNLDF